MVSQKSMTSLVPTEDRGNEFSSEFLTQDARWRPISQVARKWDRISTTMEVLATLSAPLGVPVVQSASLWDVTDERGPSDPCR